MTQTIHDKKKIKRKKNLFQKNKRSVKTHLVFFKIEINYQAAVALQKTFQQRETVEIPFFQCRLRNIEMPTIEWRRWKLKNKYAHSIVPTPCAERR